MAEKGSQLSLNELSLSSRTSTLTRTETYQERRKGYLEEKKRLSLQQQSSFEDPSLVVHEDWLMVRGSLKKWTELWCILKPGMLLLYKNKEAKSKHWIGTVLLNYCELMERPSKIDGFCFTLFHLLEQPIWATKGPDGKTINSVINILPSNHLILLTPSELEKISWMNALENCIRSPPLSKSKIDTLNHSDTKELDDFEDIDLNESRNTHEVEQEQDSNFRIRSQACSFSESDDEPLSWISEDNQWDLLDTGPQELAFTSTKEDEKGESQKQKKVTILNYIKFPPSVLDQYGEELKLEIRNGAKKDSANLRLTFEELGYEVNLHENLTSDETDQALDEVQQDESLEFLLLFVLSHGLDEDTFLTSDGSQYSLKKIQYRFTNKSCPHLRGRSKIILSNFCRGTNIEKIEWDSVPARNETPHNMITIHASHEGFRAGRTARRGTLFVYNMCETLKAQSNLSIQDLFNQIYERMAQDIGQTPEMKVSAPFANFTF